jgi:hypothetical protein
VPGTRVGTIHLKVGHGGVGGAEKKVGLLTVGEVHAGQVHGETLGRRRLRPALTPQV